jgi:ammonium transporter, Amt family
MNSGDTAWVLCASSLVLLMTPAVGFFYGGMVQPKNVLSTIMLSFSALLVVTLQWVLFGYSLAFGPDVCHLIGNLSWAGLSKVSNLTNSFYGPTIPHTLFMIFQMKFAVITPALITGAFVGRVKFPAFLIFTLLWTTLVYDPVAHWVWGVGGWIHSLGCLDFAGGTVVHITAGVAALAVALITKRKNHDKASKPEPYNIQLTLLGAFLLWFGWFGFNGGSALSANNIAVQAILTTNVAAAAGALAWMFLSWTNDRPNTVGIATGAVVGLVAITPACGFVDTFSAILIGAVAAVISYFGIQFGEKVALDDSLDVWACHGLAGTWGAIATGLFASKLVNPNGADGAFHGNPSLLTAQLISVVAVWTFTFVATYLIALAIDTWLGFTVSSHEQELGLDISQHGEAVFHFYAPLYPAKENQLITSNERRG